jgi:hypothetical protein
MSGETQRYEWRKLRDMSGRTQRYEVETQSYEWTKLRDMCGGLSETLVEGTTTRHETET